MSTMGKRTRAQRYGRGTGPYRAPPNIHIAEAKIPDWPETMSEGQKIVGVVEDIVHDPGRSAPLAIIRVWREGRIERIYLPSVEGLYVGKEIQIGMDAEIDVGNVVPIGRVPEGFYVSNVEKIFGDGGRYARSGGSYAIVRAHDPKRGITEVILPSKRTISIDSRSRCQIGIVAGGGRDELPLVKAGNAYYKWKNKPKKWPRTRGTAMNPVDHRHGGGRRRRPVKRTAPPGQKVGIIAPKRTGKRD